MPTEGDESVLVPVDASKKEDAPEKKEKGEVKPGEELSEEDQALKDGLELSLVRLEDPDDTSLHRQAIDFLINEIRTSTSSMTAVPKPLKFLRPHYERIKTIYQAWVSISHELSRKLSDVLSVLAMTMSEKGSREVLKFKLSGEFRTSRDMRIDDKLLDLIRK